MTDQNYKDEAWKILIEFRLGALSKVFKQEVVDYLAEALQRQYTQGYKDGCADSNEAIKKASAVGFNDAVDACRKVADKIEKSAGIYSLGIAEQIGRLRK